MDDTPEIIKVKKWFKDGKLHRDGDLPAVITSDGTRIWYRHGKRHRDGDLPAVIVINNGLTCIETETCPQSCEQVVRSIGIHLARNIATLDPPRHISARGETIARSAPASWFPVLCFV